MKKLTITIIVSDDISTQVLIQKLADIVPDLNEIGDITDVSLITEPEEEGEEREYKDGHS